MADVIEYSPNDVFVNLTDKDKTTEIVGFVDTLFAPKDVGKKLEYRIYKFVLSNGEKKVNCVVWNETVAKYENQIQLNRIIHITAGLTKNNQAYYDNNKKEEGIVPFEITITNKTIVEYLGFHALALQQEMVAPDPIIVDFNNIVDHDNTLVSLTGFLKQNFILMESRYRNMSYGSSAVTNGNYKINVDIANYSPLDYEKGSQVTVTGVFNYNDGLGTINCRNIDGIIVDATVPKMGPADLMRGNKFPKRRAPEQN